MSPAPDPIDKQNDGTATQHNHADADNLAMMLTKAADNDAQTLQVQLYSEANYQGASQALPCGSYNYRDLTLNHTLGSLRIPPGLKVNLFQYPGFAGASNSYHRNSAELSEFFRHHTGSISITSVEQTEQQPPKPADKHPVFIYSESNYRGKKQALFPGRYNLNELKFAAAGISALRIPKGVQVQVFSEPDCAGASMSYQRNHAFLGDYFSQQAASLAIDYLSAVPEASKAAINKPCLAFNGKDVYVSTVLDFNPQALTLSLWFKTEHPDGGLCSVEAQRGKQQGQDQQIYLHAGDLHVRCWQQSPLATQGKNYADNQWHKLSYVFDQAQGRQALYVDGLLQAESQHQTAGFERQTCLYLGYAADANQAYFQGLIAELSLWSAARSLYALSHWQAPVTGYEPDLLLFWNTQTAATNPRQLLDHSTHIHHGSIHGAAKALTVTDFPAEFVSQILQNLDFHGLKRKADAFARVGKVLGQGMPTARTNLAYKALSQWIAEGNLAHYNLMNQLTSAIYDGDLYLSPKVLGYAYADIVEHIPVLDIFTPIQNPKGGFFQSPPSHIGNSGMILDEEPEEYAKLSRVDDYSLKIAGDVRLLGQYEAKLAYADFSYIHGSPQCAFKYQLKQSLPLDVIVPAVSLVSGLELEQATLIASSSAQLFDPELDSHMEVGLNFFGNVDSRNSRNPRLAFMNQAFNIGIISLQGIRDPRACHLQSHLPAVTLLNSPTLSLSLSRASLHIALLGQPTLAHIGLRQDLRLSLHYGEQSDHLYFNGGMVLAPQRISNAYSMNGKAQSDALDKGRVFNQRSWHKPLGIQGLSIHDLSLQLDCQYADDWLQQLAIHGSLEIGSHRRHVALLFDHQQPDHYALCGDMQGLTLAVLLAQLAPNAYVNYVTELKSGRKLFKQLMNNPFLEGQLHIVPKAGRIKGLNFATSGVHLSAQLLLWGMPVYVQAQIDAKTGMQLHINLEPSTLGEVFSLKADNSTSPMLSCTLDQQQRLAMHVDAQLAVFNITHQGQLRAHPKGLRFKFAQTLAEIGDIQLQCTYRQQQFFARGLINLWLNLDLNSDYGCVPLRHINCSLQSKIYMSATGQFKAKLKGYFVLWGEVLRLEPLHLCVAPRDFHSLRQRVLKHVQDHANTLLGGLNLSFEDWQQQIRANNIQLNGSIAAVSQGLYQRSAASSASVYRHMGKNAETTVSDLSQFYPHDAAHIAHALAEAGFSASENLNALESHFALGAANAAMSLKKAGFPLNELAPLLAKYYALDDQALITVLKNADYALSDMVASLAAFDKLEPQSLKRLLTQAGFSRQAIRAFFKTLGGDFTHMDFYP